MNRDKLFLAGNQISQQKSPQQMIQITVAETI